MSGIVFAPALAPSLFDFELMSRTVRITNKFWTSLPDVCHVLDNAKIPPENIIALQKGKREGEGITVVLKELEDVNTLRSVDFHTYGNKRFYVTRIDKQTIFVRLHWLPAYITDRGVKHIMASYGKVISVENAVAFHGPNNAKIYTGVKIVQLEVTEVERTSIPHIIKFQCGNSVLITGGGRPPICLKCNMVGHMRRDCPAKSHYRSYADAANNITQDPVSTVNIGSVSISGELEADVEATTVQAMPETQGESKDEEMEEVIQGKLAAQAETLEDIPLIIDEDPPGSETDVEFTEAETRGLKRTSNQDEVTDSFQTVFPPQKSMRPSETSPGATTYNRYSLLDEESLSQVAESSSDGGESPGDVLAGLMGT